MTAQSLMTKAHIACESARVLLELQDSDGACNRAYYAMFDAARAALMATNAEIPLHIGKTHSGVLTAFSQHLVKNGPVPRDIGRLLKQAEEIRLIADYSGDSITLDDARALVDKAEIFVDTLFSILTPPPASNGAQGGS